MGWDRQTRQNTDGPVPLLWNPGREVRLRRSAERPNDGTNRRRNGNV